jgi:hypothetical protein
MQKGQIFNNEVAKPGYPYGNDRNLTPTSHPMKKSAKNEPKLKCKS